MATESIAAPRLVTSSNTFLIHDSSKNASPELKHGSRKLLCRLDPPSPCLDAEKNLELFSKKLQTYMNETYFDVRTFKERAKYFQRELYEIESSIEDFYHYEQLADRLSFARHIFTTMVNSINKLKIYTENTEAGNLEQHLVYCLIQLNVRILALYDYQGYPDIANPQFEEKVQYHKQSLNFWEGIFLNLRIVDSDIQREFVEQYNRASYTLRAFANAVLKNGSLSEIESINPNYEIIV